MACFSSVFSYVNKGFSYVGDKISSCAYSFGPTFNMFCDDIEKDDNILKDIKKKKKKKRSQIIIK